MDIPIIIVCYNNYGYVKNTLDQLLKINKEYYKNIQILNNNSTCLHTIDFLNKVDVKVVHNTNNNGPRITKYKNKHIYDILPNKFILTDPDLKLNENIPTNFIEILSNLSDKYKLTKIGFALDISDFDKMYPMKNYIYNFSIYDWEKQFWKKKVDDDNYELYQAPIDTTFCLVNKKYMDMDNSELGQSITTNMRIAGDFVAKHLPWYIENEIYNIYENYISNTNTTKISSISQFIPFHIEEKYLKIYKNNEFFFIENNEANPYLHFWKNVYSVWHNETFEIVDRYLSQDKIFIDIGGWIGPFGMYASRKSKHVYSIEGDNSSFNDMVINFKTNCIQNYTLINNVDHFQLQVDKNKQIIALKNIIQTYEINTSEISFIRLDIKGKEENILNELFNIHIIFKIPVYIKIYYSMWKDANLDRFSFLSDAIKNKIKIIPDIFLLFEKNK